MAVPRCLLGYYRQGMVRQHLFVAMTDSRAPFVTGLSCRFVRVVLCCVLPFLLSGILRVLKLCSISVDATLQYHGAVRILCKDRRDPPYYTSPHNLSQDILNSSIQDKHPPPGLLPFLHHSSKRHGHNDA